MREMNFGLIKKVLDTFYDNILWEFWGMILVNRKLIGLKIVEEGLCEGNWLKC